MAKELDIAIELPEKHASSSLGRLKPKGRVALRSGSSTQFRIVPVSVARALLKLQESGDLHVPSLAAFSQTLSQVYEDCAWKRLVGLIDMRDYSSKEALEKLRLDGFPEDVREAAVERAKGCYLIDDMRYGEFFIRGKINAGWGMERIQRELEVKGIQPQSVPGWPDEYFSDEADYERAYAIASRKHLTGKNDFQKLMRLLASKGYPASLAYRVVHDVLDGE